MLGTLTLVYACLLEVLVALGHHFSAGLWPAPIKFWVVTSVTLLAAIYKLTLRKKHRAYDPVLKNAELTERQAALILCFVMGWVALMVWLAIGPPGPEFTPA